MHSRLVLAPSSEGLRSAEAKGKTPKPTHATLSRTELTDYAPLQPSLLLAVSEPRFLSLCAIFKQIVNPSIVLHLTSHMRQFVDQVVGNFALFWCIPRFPLHTVHSQILISLWCHPRNVLYSLRPFRASLTERTCRSLLSMCLSHAQLVYQLPFAINSSVHPSYANTPFYSFVLSFSSATLKRTKIRLRKQDEQMNIQCTLPVPTFAPIQWRRLHSHGIYI